MSRRSKRRRKTGLSPGTAMYMGDHADTAVGVTVFEYGCGQFVETQGVAAAFAPLPTTPGVVRWVNVEGVHDAALISRFGEHYRLHPLAVEDVLNPGTRPKVEEYDEFVFLVAKNLEVEPCTPHLGHARRLRMEQVSFVLGKDFLLTFLEDPGDAFDPVRDRLRTGRGRLRSSGASYLAYALLDAMVDDYFVVMDSLGEDIERLENQVLLGEPTELAQRVHLIREDLRAVRKVLMPMSTAVGALRAGGPLVNPEVHVFLRDLADHVAQVSDLVDNDADSLISLLDTHLALSGQKQNEITKVLTVVGTIFIPLTFVVGVYGMNFEMMPELHWRFGYFGVMGLMGLLTVAQVIWLRRRRWL